MDPALRAYQAALLIVAATQDRDDAIRELRAQGMTVRAIAELVGLSHPGVLKILKR